MPPGYGYSIIPLSSPVPTYRVVSGIPNKDKEKAGLTSSTTSSFSPLQGLTSSGDKTMANSTPSFTVSRASSSITEVYISSVVSPIVVTGKGSVTTVDLTTTTPLGIDESSSSTGFFTVVTDKGIAYTFTVLSQPATQDSKDPTAGSATLVTDKGKVYTLIPVSTTGASAPKDSKDVFTGSSVSAPATSVIPPSVIAAAITAAVGGIPSKDIASIAALIGSLDPSASLPAKDVVRTSSNSLLSSILAGPGSGYGVPIPLKDQTQPPSVPVKDKTQNLDPTTAPPKDSMTGLGHTVSFQTPVASPGNDESTPPSPPLSQITKPDLSLPIMTMDGPTPLSPFIVSTDAPLSAYYVPGSSMIWVSGSLNGTNSINCTLSIGNFNGTNSTNCTFPSGTPSVYAYASDKRLSGRAYVTRNAVVTGNGLKNVVRIAFGVVGVLLFLFFL